MGCDIHLFVQVKTSSEDASHPNWKTVEWGKLFPGLSLDHRNYSVFAFLANVRNYDCCTPLSELKGLPNDLNDNEIIEEYDEAHSASYFTLSELLAFDYDQTFENRRVTKQTGPNTWDGSCIAEKGEGRIVSYRDNLGNEFFDSLKLLQTLGDGESVRIVFFFDN